MFAKLAPVAAFLALAVQPALGAGLLVSRATSDVFVPPITYPTAGTVWNVGQNLNVTWDISNAPQNVTNTMGMILLRKGGITTPLIVRNNFSIFDGTVIIAVPLVVEGDDYSIILMGNSGNVSPDFTITGSGVEF